MHTGKLTFLAVLIFIGLSAMAQGWGDNDSLRMIALHHRGVKVESTRVVAWFPADSLPHIRMNAILDTLNRGIAKAEEFLGSPFAWQVFAEKQIVFYFSPERFISHASWDGQVFIPFWRLKSGQSPWLHEALHIIFRSKKGSWGDVSREERAAMMPLWLTEGLPDYADMKIVHQENFSRFDLWKDGGLLKTDSSCRGKLLGEHGEYILKFVGSPGTPPELFGEHRGQYAPAFYNCASSFVKFISDQYGVGVLVEAIAEFKNEHHVIEQRTGKSIEQIKQEWIDKVLSGNEK